jgi:hypothetical protein
VGDIIMAEPLSMDEIQDSKGFKMMSKMVFKSSEAAAAQPQKTRDEFRQFLARSPGPAIA